MSMAYCSAHNVERMRRHRHSSGTYQSPSSRSALRSAATAGHRGRRTSRQMKGIVRTQRPWTDGLRPLCCDFVVERLALRIQSSQADIRNPCARYLAGCCSSCGNRTSARAENMGTPVSPSHVETQTTTITGQRSHNRCTVEPSGQKASANVRQSSLWLGISQRLPAGHGADAMDPSGHHNFGSHSILRAGFGQ